FEDCCAEVHERRGKYSYVASREGGEFSHDSPPQRERQERALQTILLELDREGKKARFLSSTDEVTTYETSLDWCTCTDYARRHLPCKHMYRLANEVGIF
ncbi:SWIM zinc finger family protein, partial [Aminomonas paucivorans]|uniref:SWIM zinc finger family protein n=1 Tax=Aminomonas paucivorans TaxID=81412 RepID=UPI00331BDF80